MIGWNLPDVAGGGGRKANDFKDRLARAGILVTK
jgi:hypothetical protein